MKKTLLITLVLMVSASMAFAQGGSIGIFGDTGGTSCNITDAAPGLLSIYLVHVNTPGATASQFAAPTPACMVGAQYLSQASPFAVVIGNSQTGVAIGYGACYTGPVLVLTLSYFAGGTSSPCCYFQVVPDPLVPSGQIEVVDCAENLLFATGGVGIVNADATCLCDVPTQDTTWGKVKSLFSE
jgi:hypothetical protein